MAPHVPVPAPGPVGPAPHRPWWRRGPAITPRTRILAAAAIVLATGTVSSFALFSDSGSVRSTFSAGTLDLKFDAEQDGAPDPYVVEFTGGDELAPGVAVTRDLVVYNSGSVPATLGLTAPAVSNADPGAAPLQDQMTLTVAAPGGQVLYDGPLTTAAFDGLDLGAGGTTATGTTLTLSVAIDEGAGVEVAGQSVQVDLPFTAVQSTTP